MSQTHSKQTKFNEGLWSKNTNAQTQLLRAQRLYQEEHKLIRKRKLHENRRNSTELKCQSASPKTVLQTEPSSARNSRGGQSGAGELIPG